MTSPHDGPPDADATHSAHLHQQALAMRTELGEKGTAAESRMALAALALEEGRAAEAEQLARDAAAMFAAQSAPDNEAMALATIALASLAQSKLAPAQRDADRAVALVRNPQHVLARLPVSIAAARVQGATNVPAALKALDLVRTEAAAHGIVRFELDARRAAVEVESRRSLAAGAALGAALRKDAAERGFGLYAR